MASSTSRARQVQCCLTPRSSADPARQGAWGRRQPGVWYCLSPAPGALPRRSA